MTINKSNIALNDTTKNHIERVYSKKYHNIYLFVTEKCQNRCGHCYMGTRLKRGMSMSLDMAIGIIDELYRLGAECLTFVGGEPTLHPDLHHMVNYAEKVGYKKIMIDTNGLLIDRIINNITPDRLYYVRVSLDGSQASIHDRVRGDGSFNRTINSIRKLVERGYHVRITTTVFKFSLQDACQILALADELGIELVNFHIFSKEGLGVDKYDWFVSQEEWELFCEQLCLNSGQYKTIVRYPPTWVRGNKLDMYKHQGYNGCLGYSMDRLSIFPDRRCYICPVLFDFPANYAFFSHDYGLKVNKNGFEYKIFSSTKGSGDFGDCPAEHCLTNEKQNLVDNNFISICRLWRSEL